MYNQFPWCVFYILVSWLVYASDREKVNKVQSRRVKLPPWPINALLASVVVATYSIESNLHSCTHNKE